VVWCNWKGRIKTFYVRRHDTPTLTVGSVCGYVSTRSEQLGRGKEERVRRGGWMLIGLCNKVWVCLLYEIG